LKIYLNFWFTVVKARHYDTTGTTSVGIQILHILSPKIYWILCTYM